MIARLVFSKIRIIFLCFEFSWRLYWLTFSAILASSSASLRKENELFSNAQNAHEKVVAVTKIF